MSGPRRAALAWAAALAALLLATVLGLPAVPPHAPEGPVLRLWPPAADAASDPAGPLAGWTVERGRGRVEVLDGILRLEAPRADPYVLLRRPLEPEPTTVAYRVRAEARFSGTGGLRPVEAARIHLLGRDAEGRLLPDRLEDALRARADRDWSSVAADLALPPGAASAELLVRLQRTAGRLELRGLELVPLAPSPAREAARAGLALAWLALVAAGGALLLRFSVHRRWALAALLAAPSALALILVPPELALRLLPPGLVQTALSGAAVPYLAHAGLGFTLALTAARATGTRAFRLPALLVLVAAAAGEALQLLTAGRDASPADALANATGGLAGLLLALALGRLEGPDGTPGTPEPRAEIEAALPLVPLEAPGPSRG